jgi:hypothetical protein
MSISFRWQDDTHRLLLITFEGPWTWEDLFSTAQACNDVILGEPHPVCIIADTLGMDGIPAGNLVEIGMRLVRQYVVPNAAILVLVTVHPLLRSTGLGVEGHLPNPGDRSGDRA